MRKPTSTLHTKMWFVVKLLAAVLIIAIIQKAAVEAKYLDGDYEEDVYDDPYDEIDEDILEDEMRRMIEENLVDSQLVTAQTGSQDTIDNENMDVDRRNIFQLADMVKLKTGSNALKYANYGCYCGIGGKGTPIDNLDRCCQAHDQCYSDISCRFQHFNAYSWKNDGGNIVCQSESLPCDQEQCSCDKVLAECLASHHSEYNKDFSTFWWLISKHWKC